MSFAFLLLGGIVGAGVLLFLLIRLSLDRLSGWNNLAACYGVPRAPAVWDWKHATIRVGSVRYRRCMRIAVQPEGLYLDEAGLPGHVILCIPWKDLRNPTSSRLYGRPSVRLLAGPGTVELPVELYESVMRLAPRQQVQS